jgi:uncharacterized membrane protein YjfL (UPF0719 family)
MNDRAAPLPHVANPGASMWQPPTRVLLAVRLLWISLALGIPSLMLEILHSSTDVGSFVSIVFELALLAFSAYINVSLYRARNWARVVALLLTLLELVALGLMHTPSDSTAIEVALAWVSTAMDVAAMYLLFTPPAPKWFKHWAEADA